MTVGELVRLLSDYDQDESLSATWDTGCAGGEIVGIERDDDGKLWLVCD